MSWVFKAMAQKLESGSVSDLCCLLHMGLLRLKTGLDRFLHFRLAIMKRECDTSEVGDGLSTSRWSLVSFFCFCLAFKRYAEC